MPAAPLVSLTKYQEATGSDANPERQLEAIEDASQAILNLTDRDFGSEAVTETREVRLPAEGYIVDIDDATEITDVNGLAGYTWRAWGEGPAATYGVLTYLEVRIRLSSPLMGFARNHDRFGSYFHDDVIEVTGTWGWPEVPGDVERACIWTASAMEGDADNLQGTLAAKSVAEVAENYMQQQQQTSGGRSDEEALPSRARALLLPYMRTKL